jgi:MFS family permease
VGSVTPNKDEVSARLSLVTAVMHIGTLGGVFFFPWLARSRGRKFALGTGFGLAILATTALVVLPHTFESLLAIMPFIAFPAIGLTAVFGLYFPELFPSKIRATGAGFGYNFARLLTAPIPIWTGMLILNFPKTPAIGIGLAALIYLIGMGALLVAPETKDQPLPT